MSAGPGWWLAVDFGTSFTTTAMSVDGRVEILEIDNSRYVPSVVCLDEDGAILVGRDAVNEAAANPARAERLPKRAMVVSEQVRLGDRSVPTVDLVAAVLHRVTSEAMRRRSGRAPDRVVLTHPARWQPGGIELRRLAEAAERAGLGEPDLVAEPVAAAHHYVRDTDDVPLGGAVGVYDLGGGTFDTAVLRRRHDGFELAGSPGGDLHLGGEDLDAELMEVLAGHAEAIDPDRWNELWEASGRGAERHRTMLRREVTQAKESLSTRPAVNLYVPGFDDEIRVTRHEYEKAVDAILQRSVVEMVGTIERAGATPASLVALYLTGGSSRTPRITALLAELIERLPTTQDDPKAVVAQGALATIPGSVSATMVVRRPGRGAVRSPAGRPDTSPPRTDPGAEIAAEIAEIAEAAGVLDLVGAVAPTVLGGAQATARLRTSLDGVATAIATRFSPFPGLPPEIALRVLQEGRAELGALGQCLTRMDRVSARLAET